MKEQGKDKGHTLLAGAAKAASLNIVLQLMLRLLTFGLNAFVLRFITKDLLGVVNVRLTLLFSTTMYLATDAFDKACLSNLERQNWSRIINLMWCCVPASIVISGTLGWIWIYLLEVPDPSLVPNYTLGVFSFAVSTVLVILSRPLFILGQKCLFVKLKVLSQGIAELCKCGLTVILIIYIPQLGLINFAIAQVLYGMVTVGVYYGYFIYYISKKDETFPIKSARELFPVKQDDQTFILPEQTHLTVSIFKQSVLKQFLSEGERYVMTVFDVLSFADQGIFDVVSNLGSMVARFVFFPIEESGYVFFSQLLVRGEPLEKQDKDSLKLATEVLGCMTKMMVLFGAINVTFGYAYSYLALDLYGGQLLSSGTGPMLLRWYCVYMLVLAINGISECFVFTTMSKTQVDLYNRKMLLFSATFLAASLLLTRYFGSVGFLLANSLNMSARILHSLYYIQQYYKDSDYRPLLIIIPSPSVVLALAVSFCITTTSEVYFCCDRGIFYRLVHIGVGGLCLLAVLGTIYLKETHAINFIRTQYRQRQKRE